MGDKILLVNQKRTLVPAYEILSFFIKQSIQEQPGWIIVKK